MSRSAKADDPKSPSSASVAFDDEVEDRPLTMPGAEFPSAVYVTVIAAFAWMLVMAWLAFSSSDGTDLDLGIATGFALVFFGVPLAIHHMVAHLTHRAQIPMRKFLAAPFDTFTGEMPPRQAWLEVAIIPISLAIAATLIGTVFLLAR